MLMRLNSGNLWIHLVKSGGCLLLFVLCIILYQCFLQWRSDIKCGNPVQETAGWKLVYQRSWVFIVLKKNCQRSLVLKTILSWDPAQIKASESFWSCGLQILHCLFLRINTASNGLNQKYQHILPSVHINPTTVQHVLRPNKEWDCIKQVLQASVT